MRVTMPVLVLLIGVAASPAVAVAQEPHDPIDQAFDRCLGGPDARTTAGQVRCVDAAYQAWENELDATEKALMQQLDPKSQALLRDSQQQWRAYRDADFAFLSGPWSQKRGTMMQVMSAASSVDRVRGRVMVLRGYLALLGEN